MRRFRTKKPFGAGRCGQTNKRCFKSHRDAEAAIRSKGQLMRVYRCQFCGLYHLTSQVKVNGNGNGQSHQSAAAGLLDQMQTP